MTLSLSCALRRHVRFQSNLSHNNRFNSLLCYVIISTAQHVSTSLDNWRYCLKFLYPVTLSKWSSWVPPCCFYNLWKGYFVILLHEKFLKFDWLRAVVFPLNLKYLHVKITNLLWVVFRTPDNSNFFDLPWRFELWAVDRNHITTWQEYITSLWNLNATPNANMADLPAGPGLVARKRG